MRRRDRGFTLVEVMVTLVVLMLAMAAVSTFFVGSRGRGGVVNLFKQQSRIAQTGMDTIVGLEILRKDIEHAGYGLPWNNIPAYSEADPGVAAAPAASLNDSPSAAPRGIVSANGGGAGVPDYLVVKASNVAMNAACRKWTTLQVGDDKRFWTTVPANAENLGGNDRVIVLSPGSAGSNWRSLVVTGGWSTTFNNTSAFAPGLVSDPRVIYGIDSQGGTPLRFPFNRADYLIDTASVPQHCAPNTGVLVKRVLRQDNGGLDAALPLLDCVATIQVQYMLDTDGDGVVNGPSPDVSALTAEEIRDQVRQVRVSLLAHEGQRDPGYTHSTANIPVGGTTFDIGANLNYRWKVYEIDVTPENLRN